MTSPPYSHRLIQNGVAQRHDGEPARKVQQSPREKRASSRRSTLLSLQRIVHTRIFVLSSVAERSGNSLEPHAGPRASKANPKLATDRSRAS